MLATSSKRMARLLMLMFGNTPGDRPEDRGS
jgi:hypothetical protein